MLNVIEARTGKPFSHDPARRGYHAVYHPNEVNRCPGCGRSHWYIGRMTAECSFCATALPLIDPGMVGAGTFRRSGRVQQPVDLAA